MIRDVHLFEAFKLRTSIRAFKTRTIEKEVMAEVLKAVRSAPSAGNLQAYQVYVVDTPSKIETLGKAAYNQTCVSGAPAVLVFCIDPPHSAATYGDRGRTLYCVQDATIAATFAHLAAVGLGLGSVMVGAFRETDVARIIGAPATQLPILLLPLGYADEAPIPTSRRPLDDIVVWL